MNDLSTPVTDSREASYDPLEKALREHVKQQPSLLLARVMLLELLFKTGRRSVFLSEAKKLYQRIDNPDKSFEWQRCASMGRVLDPATEIYRVSNSALLDAAEAATAASASAARKMRRFGEQDEYVTCFRELSVAFEEAQKQRDRRFQAGLDVELLHMAGRPSSLLHLVNLSRQNGGAQIYLKREDLAPPETHMTMMVGGQALLARHLGCKALVTSTVNGARGLTVAAMAARYSLNCIIFMAAQDSQTHFRKVFQMSLMDADLLTIEVSRVRNHDVREVALAHWAANPKDYFMVTGLDAVPAPYPAMHREFTSAIGRECKRQVLAAAKRIPDVIVARGRKTADALSLFPPFLAETHTRLVCVEPGTDGSILAGLDEGMETFSLEPLSDDEKRLAPDILEGIDYPSVEREHAWLESTGRVEYISVGDDEIGKAISDLGKLEGLIPSLDTARLLAWACEEARRRDPTQAVVIMVTQNAEKDMPELQRRFGFAI